MKKVLIVILIVLVGLGIAAQVNYLNAINAVKRTKETDSDIELTMRKYGFYVQWSYHVTMKDKIIALFN